MIPHLRTQWPVQRDFGLPMLPQPYVDALPASGGITVTYYGYSPLNVQETDAVWLIVRETVNGTVTKYEYPNSSMDFNQAWANRATLTYTR